MEKMIRHQVPNICQTGRIFSIKTCCRSIAEDILNTLRHEMIIKEISSSNASIYLGEIRNQITN